jgi:NAD(P)-dependent dehydrogenase (short-subunit alcohol dehydrogenase family)
MRTYVITGSASGIGLATASLLRARGDVVIGVDRHHAEVIADLSTARGREDMVRGVAARSGGHVDAVVANAGLASPTADTVAVNYYGALATLEGLRPLLLRSPNPRAVATASMASLLPVDEQLERTLLDGSESDAMELADKLAQAGGATIDATTKRALARWIRRHAATDDWAGAGIPLNAIAPGIIRTPMTADLIGTPEATASLLELVPMPLHGIAQPQACASLITWLISTDNTHLCGQVIFIDGGSDVLIRGDSTC